MLKNSLQMLQIVFLPGSICEELLQGPARHQVGGKRQDEDIIAAVRRIGQLSACFLGILGFFCGSVCFMLVLEILISIQHC